MPDFPTVHFELGWRNVVDAETQLWVIAQVKELCGSKHLKVYLGIKWLAENPNVRPGELITIREKQILLEQKIILVREFKERSLDRAKVVLLEDEDVELLKTLPRALPDVFFFRHETQAVFQKERPTALKSSISGGSERAPD